MRDPYPGNIIPSNDPLRSRGRLAIRGADGAPGPARPVEQRGRQPGGRSDMGAGPNRNILVRLDHTFSPKFKAMFSGYYNNRPSVRNCGGVQGCDVPNDPAQRFRIEHGLHRRGLHPAHLHDARPHPVGLDHQQQPDEPLHRGLGPLVHGRLQSLRGRELAREAVGVPSRQAASSSGTRGRRRSTSERQHPLQHRRSLDWPRFGFEKNDRWQFSTDLAWVTGRSTIKVGFEYRHHKYPHKGWDRGGRRRQLRFQPARHRRLRRRRATTSARPAIPSRRSSWGRCTRPTS